VARNVLPAPPSNAALVKNRQPHDQLARLFWATPGPRFKRFLKPRESRLSPSPVARRLSKNIGVLVAQKILVPGLIRFQRFWRPKVAQAFGVSVPGQKSATFSTAWPRRLCVESGYLLFLTKLENKGVRFSNNGLAKRRSSGRGIFQGLPSLPFWPQRLLRLDEVADRFAPSTTPCCSIIFGRIFCTALSVPIGRRKPLVNSS